MWPVTLTGSMSKGKLTVRQGLAEVARNVEAAIKNAMMVRSTGRTDNLNLMFQEPYASIHFTIRSVGAWADYEVKIQITPIKGG